MVGVCVALANEQNKSREASILIILGVGRAVAEEGPVQWHSRLPRALFPREPAGPRRRAPERAVATLVTVIDLS